MSVYGNTSARAGWGRAAVWSDELGSTARLVPPALTAMSGMLWALAQPPADLWQASWVCLVPLLVAIRACRSARGAALAAFAFGILSSALVAGWLPGTVATFFHVGWLVGWLVALAVYALFAALPFAAFGALAHGTLRRGTPLAVGLSVPALWVAAEMLRATVAGGLPWTLLGHALHRVPLLIQIADVGGVFAVSALVAAVNVGVFLAVRARRARLRALLPLAVCGVLVAGVTAYGAVRLRQVTADTAARLVTVGVLQPNQAPVYHWTPVAAERALVAHARLSQEHFAKRAPDLVVWPENAIPLYPEEASTGARLGRLAAQLGAPLILGAPAAGATEDIRFNAAHLIVPGAGPRATYHKRRLVPFAEYRPGGGAGASAFTAGRAPVLFAAAGVAWGPTICLDLIYPAVARASVLAGAEALVNVSNDSWLAAGGRGAAAQQFAQAVFRAVETRRDVVRAATTGISGVVNAAGVPTAVLAEGARGALIAPVAPRRTLTFYTRAGDCFAFGCIALAAVMLGAPRLRRRFGRRADA